jgi:hypothetical protein
LRDFDGFIGRAKKQIGLQSQSGGDQTRACERRGSSVT